MKKIGLLGCTLLVSLISFGQAKKKVTQKKVVANKNATPIKQNTKTTIAQVTLPKEENKIERQTEVLAEYPGGTSYLFYFLVK